MIKTVFIGGSNTVASGYHNHVSRWLDEHFTSSEVNSGIGGTASWYGLIRLQEDVIDHAPDMVIIEFAVNDASDLVTSIRATGWQGAGEALIRRIKAALPNCKIMVVNLVQQEDYVPHAGYVSSRDKWAAIANHYGLDINRIDLWLQGVIGTPTPTQEQCQVYGDLSISPQRGTQKYTTC
jgi:lysophospholipase L1-like esterase